MEPWQVKQVVNVVNGSTLLGLAVATVGRARIGRGPRGLLVATGYRLAAAGRLGVHGRQRGRPRKHDRAWLDERPALMRHEERHTWQYVACLGLPMLPLYRSRPGWSYLRGGDSGVHNAFERLAGLEDGGYPTVSARVRRRQAGVVGLSGEPGPAAPAPRRAVDHDVGRARRAPPAPPSPSRPAASAGPASRSPRTASNASRSPRSSPANSTPPAWCSSRAACTARPLCMPGARTSSTIRPGSRPARAARRRRPAPPPAGRSRPRRRAAAACARRPRGPSPPRTRRRRRSAASSAGSSSRKAWSPRGGSGDVNSRVPESQRSLPYCPITTSRGPSASASATASRPPSSTTWRAGRPVITTTARTRAARRAAPAARRGGSPPGPGPRRSGTACRRSPGRRGPRRATATSASYRSWDGGSLDPARMAGVTGSGVVAGEDHGEPVAAHRGDRRA